MSLPRSVIEEDRKLEQASDNATVELMRLRWHWTLDESNAERISVSEYARQVGRKQPTIFTDARGYQIYLTGKVSADEARKRANMTAETQAAVEAVAEARGLKFTYASKEFAPEARHIRESARQRAEEKGTSVLEEIPRVAAITYTAQEAERERDERRAERTPLRHIEIEARLLDAERALVKAIHASERVELSREDRELLGQTLDNVKRLIVIAERAIVDAYDTSWRSEFHLIEGGLAS